MDKETTLETIHPRLMKYKEIFSDAKKWLSDSTELMFRQPGDLLAAYANGDDVGTHGQIAGACWALARWHEKSFVAAAGTEESIGTQHLLQSLEFDLLDLFIQDRIRKANPEKRFMDYSYRSHGLLLAKAAAVGDLVNFELLGARVVSNRRKDVYAGVKTTNVGPFMLGLYSSYSNAPRISYPEMDTIPVCYRAIVDRWRDGSTTELESAMLDAAELHVAESKDDTNKRNHDFSEHFYRVFPAEMLAVLQFRRSRKLPEMAIDHPIFSLPTAILIEPKERPASEICELVRARAVEDL